MTWPIQDVENVWDVRIPGHPNRNARKYMLSLFENHPFTPVQECYEPVGDTFSEETLGLIKKSVLYNLMAQSVRKQKKEEFSAGDTKLLDEYLNSFLQTRD